MGVPTGLDENGGWAQISVGVPSISVGGAAFGVSETLSSNGVGGKVGFSFEPLPFIRLILCVSWKGAPLDVSPLRRTLEDLRLSDNTRDRQHHQYIKNK
jgi:hypothetical protein